MKAVYIKKFGAAENIEIREVEDLPKPQRSEISIEVKAAALNRADVLQRQGFYPAPPGAPEMIPGLEYAGVVAAVGDEVENFQIGDRVFGITAGGAQAEYLLTDESLAVKIPENLSFVEAAAVPEAFITAHDAIFTNGGLQADDTLLIHAVGSGVGLAALQLAKARGIKTLGTSRTAEKLEKCRRFGLDSGIAAEGDALTTNPKEFGEIIRHKTENKGVNVILDLVGAPYLAANLECLSVKGRLVMVGLTGGRTAELNMGLVLAKRAKIIGTVLRSRSVEEKAAATRKFAAEVVPLLAAGEIVPNVDRVFDYQSVARAHEYLESNDSFGKVVLEF